MYRKHEQAERARYEQEKEQHKNIYEDDQAAKERFEKWKKQQFSNYDQEIHDDFLKTRYQRTFYKY